MVTYTPKNTDWSGELDKKQQRRLNQLANHVKLLDKQADDQYTADTTNTTLDFIQTIGTELLPKAGAEALRQSKAIQKEVNQEIGNLGLGIDDIGQVKSYLSGKKELLKDGVEADKVASKIINPKARDYFLSLHGRERIYAKEYLVGRVSSQLPVLWDKWINDPTSNDQGLTNAEIFSRATGGAEGDVSSKIDYMRDWAGKQFGPELLHKGLIQQNGLDNINTWLKAEQTNYKTSETSIRHGTNTQQFRDRAIQYATGDPANLTSFITNEIDSLAAHLSGQVLRPYAFGAILDGEYIEGLDISDTHRQQAAKIIFSRLERIGLNGDITEPQFFSALKTWVSHPAGDSLEVYFDKEGIDKQRIYKAFRTGAAAKAKVLKAARNTEIELYAEDLKNRFGGVNNYNKVELQNGLNRLEAMGASTAITGPLSNMLKSNQSPIDESNQRAVYFGDDSKVIKELFGKDNKEAEKEISMITNTTVRGEVQAIYNKHKLIRRNTYGIDEGEGQTRSRNQDLVTRKTDLEVGPSGNLPGQGELVTNELIQAENDFIYKGIERGLSGEDLQGWVASKMETYWNTHSAKGGKYQYDPTDGFINFDTALIERGEKISDLFAIEDAAVADPTNEQILNWNSKVEKGFEKHNGYENPTVRTDMLQDKGLLIGGNDFIGMVRSGQYSAKLKHIATKLNLPYGTVFEAQLRAFIEGANEQELAVIKKFKLDQIQIPDGEARLYESLEDKPSVLNLIKQRGLENLTNKELLRTLLVGSKMGIEDNTYDWSEFTDLRKPIYSRETHLERQQIKENIATNKATINVKSFAEQPEEDNRSEVDLDAAYEEAGLF